MGGSTSTGFGRNEESSNWRVVDFNYNVSPTEARGLIRYLTANLTGNCSISFRSEVIESFERSASQNKQPKTVEERVDEANYVSSEIENHAITGDIYRYKNDSMLSYTLVSDDSNFPLITHFYRMELTRDKNIDIKLDDKHKELANDIKATVRRYFLDKEVLRKRRDNLVRRDEYRKEE